jgi:FkbM family methyltransferase
MNILARLLLRSIWLLAWPLRAYWLHSDRKLGKHLLVDRLLKPLLPPAPHGFTTTVPGGARIRLHYREDLGLAVLLRGSWEQAELEYAARVVRPDTTAVDVGANVGIHTAVLANAVGPGGRVLAFEPEPGNAERLRENITRNGFSNVEIHTVALTNRSGETVLRLGSDPMNHSTVAAGTDSDHRGRRVVEMRALDDVWRERGSPTISFVKVDTEGSEFEVLEGAAELLAAERPTLLVEVRDPRVEPWLAARGYAAVRPSGFAPGNVLFGPAPSSTAVGAQSRVRM